MNRRTLTIAGVVCLALLAAWYLLLWSPKGAELASAHDRQAAASTKVEELQARVARLKDAQAHSPELQADLERVRSAIPAAADLPSFILQTDDAATKAGVEFLSITPAQPSPGTSGSTEVKLALTLKGEYQPLLGFLDELMALRRLVVLDSVSISPGDGSSLNVSLQGRMFTTALPPAPAGASSSTTSTTQPVKS